MNLCKYVKNKAVSSYCSGDIVDLKILQFDWSKTFRLISQELDFSQKWYSCWNIAIINFQYRPRNSKFSCIWPIFPIFGTQFLKIQFCHVQLHIGFSHHAKFRSQWRCSGVFIVNFEHISQLFLVHLLLTLFK